MGIRRAVSFIPLISVALACTASSSQLSRSMRCSLSGVMQWANPVQDVRMGGIATGPPRLA